MITRVQKWGNSQGLRLSKSLLSEVRGGRARGRGGTRLPR